MKKSPWNRAIALVLAFVMVCTGALAVPQTAEAASKPTKITLSAKNRTLYVGKSFTLKVKSVKPANASKAVTFKSSNTKVATVNSKGKVTGKKVGKATITVTSTSNKKVKATCKITVKQQVKSISVTNAIRRKVVVPKGKTLTLKTVVKPDNAANKGLTYTVGNPKIVTVNAKGKIKATKYGSNRIAIQSKDKQKRLVIVVYVPRIRIKSASLNATKKSLNIGKTYQLKGVFKPANASVKVVSFESSNPKVASVSTFGTVKALSPGKSVITMKTLDGNKKAKCTITVNPVKVTKVTVVPESQELVMGQQFTVSTKIAPSNATNKAVTWKSSNTDIIRVTQAGLATAVGVGTAEITATAKDGSGKSGKCVVTVVPEGGKLLIRSIKVVPAEKSMKVGEAATLEAQITLDDGTVVTESNKDQYPLSWISDRPDVATVEPETGKVTAVAVGTANISAVARDGSGEMGTCVLTVSPSDPTPAPEIILHDQKVSLQAGKTKDLSYTATPNDAQITWNSNNEEVATVADGRVTAIKAGTAIITASVKGGNTATCTVNVTSDTPQITLTEVEVNLQVGGTISLKWAVSPATAAVTWSSSNNAVASVKEGVITANAVGDAVITGSVEDGNSVNCTVHVIPGATQQPEIQLVEEEVILEVGGTDKLNWFTTPKDAEIEWKSDDPSVVDVEDGVLTAHKEGTATVSATVKGGNTATCVVQVILPKEDDEIIVVQSKISLLIGEEITLDCHKNPADAKVTWSSDNPAIAEVGEETGIVTAISRGTAIITATLEGGATATCTVTVKPASDPVLTLTQVEVSLRMGDKMKLSWSVDPVGTPVSWISDNDDVASVDEEGVIKANGEGTATITGSTQGGNSVKCLVTVVEDKPVLTLEEESLNLVVGITRPLTFAVKPEGTHVTWSSSNDDVATVSEDGKVEAKSEGNATITGTVAGGNTVTCEVTVSGVTFSLSEKEISLKTNQLEGFKLNTTMKPEDLKEATISWSSDNEDVAEVSNDGVVTPREILKNEVVDDIRKATIKAIVQIDGQMVASATCEVTVIARENAEVQDDDNFIYILGADAEAYGIERGNQSFEVTKEEVAHDMALFTKKLNEVTWDNNFLKNYWDRFDTESLKESEILLLLLGHGIPEIKDIDAVTKEVTVRSRTVQVKRVDGQDSSSLIITDMNGGRQAYVEGIQITKENGNVKIAAEIGASATGKRMAIELTMSLDGKNIIINRVANNRTRPMISFSQMDDGSYEFKVNQTYYDEFIDMFGEDLDFLSQLEIYNIYYEIEQ